jgi:hypothetical protein
LPDRPRADPGVRFSRTGLLRNTRFRSQLGCTSCFAGKETFDDAWLRHLKVLEKLLEPGPVLTSALTPPVEPHVNDPSGFVRIGFKTLGIPEHSVVVNSPGAWHSVYGRTT